MPAKLINKDTVSHNDYIKPFLIIIVHFLSDYYTFSVISKRDRWGESSVANSPIRHLCLFFSKKQTGYIYSGQTSRRREQRAEWTREWVRERENKKLQQL